jgi:hypothetical protein
MTLVFRQKSAGLTHISLGSQSAALVRCRKLRALTTEVGYPRESTRQTRRSAARPNDVEDEEPFGPPTDYIEYNGMSQSSACRV